MRNKILFIITFSLLFLLASLAFSQEEKVALLTKASTNPFFVEMKRGAEAYAKDHNIPLDLFSITFETDIDKQISIMKELIKSKRYRVIILAPADSKRLVPLVKDAIDSGVYVINVDNELDRETMKEYRIEVPFIGPDNFFASEKMGRYVKFKLGGRGNVLIFEGLPGAENAILRKKSFISGLSGADIKILGFLKGEWHRDKAFSLTIFYFKKHRERIDAILCANDEMAIGVTQALDVLGKKEIIVTGYDNLTETRLLMARHKIYATVEQSPYIMGSLGVKYAGLLMSGGSMPKRVKVPTYLITHETFGKKILVVPFCRDAARHYYTLKSLFYYAKLYGEILFYVLEEKNRLYQIKEFINRGIDVILLINPEEGRAKRVGELVRETQIPVFVLKTDKHPCSKEFVLSTFSTLQDYFIGWDMEKSGIRDHIERLK